MVRFVFVFLLSVLAGPLASAAANPWSEEIEHDIAVPTMKSVLGYQPGEEITSPDDTLRYMERLAAAAPDRMKIYPYATSHEGRSLVYAVIASEENFAKLDDIKERLQVLASGTGSTANQRRRLIKELPAVTWLAYSVHGDEISPTDAGLSLAYHLLAAKNDPRVDDILEHSIVIIDPLQNPDGRARFKASFEAARGIEEQGHRFAAERDQPWPGGRFNHDLFDLNRDWFALTQPETRGKVKAVLEWNPTVFVDVHEMGSDDTYFFAPAAQPFNPYLSERQKEGQVVIGRANGAAFDENGIQYFTREVYDAFYPGYGDMWPALGGSVAMTYEQASARGLKAERSDGDVLTYADSVRNHFLASLMTAATVARNKETFLGGFVENRLEAIEAGRASKERYTVVDLSVRRSQAEALGRRLAFQGMDVKVMPAGSSVCGARYEEGALVIDAAQPQGRLITTLLETNTPLAEDFIAEQEARREAGLGHELYDVTGWSLPLMDDLSVQRCADAKLSAAKPYTEDMAPTVKASAEAAFGFAVPWTDSGQASLVIAALRTGLKAKVTDEAFTQGERTFPRGTVVFPVAGNPETLGSALAAIAAEKGGEVVSMDTSWVEDGPNFGSEHFRPLTMPKIAMAWGMGTSPLSAGATRHVLERDLGLPVTPIRTYRMGYADLRGFDVLVLPSSSWNFANVLGSDGAAAVREFAQEGGVVIALGSASGALASEDLKLMNLIRETQVPPKGKKAKKPAKGGSQPGTELWSEDDYHDAVHHHGARPDTVPGVLVRTTADQNHWLSSGYTEAVTLFRGNTIYAPLNESEGDNVFRYSDAETLLASGYLWEEVRTQLARKPFILSRSEGDGIVIAFTQDPTVRAYLNGLDLLLANAVVLGPAHAN